MGNPAAEPRNPGNAPTDGHSSGRLGREGVSFDVFEADGSYLGRVDAPDGFRLSPAPVFGEDAVWSVTRDELGVQRVVRYQIRVPS